MRKVIGGLALFGILTIGLGASFLPWDAETELYHYARQQTFRLVNPDNYKNGGTGFTVKAPSGRRYTLTNSHVCALAKEGYMIAERAGTTWKVRTIAEADDTDLCLLDPIPGTEGLDLAGESRIYDRIYIVGHPYLNPVSISTGHFNYDESVWISYCQSTGPQILGSPLDASSEMGDFMACVKLIYAWFSDAHSAPGNSGSAVLNTNGEVVGVLFAGGREQSLIVPLEPIREFLGKY